jgi:hypothetical protein
MPPRCRNRNDLAPLLPSLAGPFHAAAFCSFKRYKSRSLELAARRSFASPLQLLLYQATSRRLSSCCGLVSWTPAYSRARFSQPPAVMLIRYRGCAARCGEQGCGDDGNGESHKSLAGLSHTRTSIFAIGAGCSRDSATAPSVLRCMEPARKRMTASLSDIHSAPTLPLLHPLACVGRCRACHDLQPAIKDGKAPPLAGGRAKLLPMRNARP